MPVNVGRPDYVAALPAWTRDRDCYEGSDAVKAKGEVYLPKLGYHVADPKAYEAYKLRALFFNAMGRTVEGLAGAIFQKPPSITIEKRLEPDLKDVTLTGTSAEAFSLETTREVLKTGRYGILIDMSDARKRPYWIGYHAEAIVNWRTARMGGDEVLTMVVLCEHPEIPDPKDPFTPKTIEQYRVLELRPGPAAMPVYTQTVYRETGEGQTKRWEPYAETGVDVVMAPSHRGTTLPFIPFTFVTPIGTGAAIEKPPLDDLAHVNLSHYRGYADLKHGLHWAALPTPWVAGRTGDVSAPLTIGSAKAWELSETGKAGMLEVAGPGFGAIRQDLQDMQKMMATLGARLLEEQPTSSETMGAVGMRHAGEHATLRTVAGAIEQAMTWAATVHAWWMGTAATLAEAGATVELNKEYFQVKASPDVVRVALLALQAEKISQAQFFNVLRTGEWTRSGVTVEQEMAEILREGGGGPDDIPADDPGADPLAPPKPKAAGGGR